MAHVIIDPGHGGTTSVGGSSPFGAKANGCVEKDINLAIARRVVARLGSAAQLTRDHDVNLSLRERAVRAARSGARALISIHTGADPSGGHGGEVWIHDRHDARSAILAEEIHHSLDQVGPSRGVMRGPLALLDPSSGVPACLIEVDNLGTPTGRQRLTSAQGLDRIAEAIAGGVQSYMARFGDAGAIAVREVADPDGLAPRYRGDQNLGSVTFYGYLRPSLDFTNRFIWLVWPQRRNEADPPAIVDIDLTIELFDHDPQTDPNAAPIDQQVRRIQLSEGGKFGYEYSRLPAGDIYLRLQFTDYSATRDAGELLWTNCYG